MCFLGVIRSLCCRVYWLKIGLVDQCEVRGDRISLVRIGDSQISCDGEKMFSMISVFNFSSIWCEWWCSMMCYGGIWLVWICVFYLLLWLCRMLKICCDWISICIGVISVDSRILKKVEVSSCIGLFVLWVSGCDYVCRMLMNFGISRKDMVVMNSYSI